MVGKGGISQQAYSVTSRERRALAIPGQEEPGREEQGRGFHVWYFPMCETHPFLRKLGSKNWVRLLHGSVLCMGEYGALPMPHALAFSGQWRQTRTALGRNGFRSRLCCLLSVELPVHFHLPDPWLPHLNNGCGNSTPLIGLRQEFNHEMYTKYLAVSVPSKCKLFLCPSKPKCSPKALGCNVLRSWS